MPPAPIPLEEAQQRLLAMADPPPAEQVPTQTANGRYLARPVTALRMQPAADLSAMDGYAMQAGDPTGPWRLIGESRAGHPFSGALESGQAVRISTGALMPDGAELVLLQEDAIREGDTLSLSGSGEPSGRHIRRAGFDFVAGEHLLEPGMRIGPAQIALALAGGNPTLQVGRRPTLAILDSGDELSSDPASCAPHQIPASNGAMLAAMAAPYAETSRIGPVPDRMEALLDALEQAREADVIVTSGGASVGDHDLVRPALERWGAEIAFWRVAIKPGKPLMVARRGNQLIVGLPGNPVSSYVTALLFLLPLLRVLGGAKPALAMPATVRLALAEGLPESGDRLEFVRAARTGGGITPLGEQDSSALAALARADGLIRREIRSPAAMPGESVPVYLLENGGIA